MVIGILDALILSKQEGDGEVASHPSGLNCENGVIIARPNETLSDSIQNLNYDDMMSDLLSNETHLLSDDSWEQEGEGEDAFP